MEHQPFTFFPDRGLTDSEAETRRFSCGENRLVGKKRTSKWVLFFSQFADWMIGILLVATAISFAMGDSVEAIAILLLVLLNAFLGFFQECRTERTIESLNAMSAPKARVMRNGKEKLLDPAFLVPGDLLLLEAGDRIPADGVLLSAVGMQCDESLLTGESIGIPKEALPNGLPLPENEAGCKERIYMGSLILCGHGRGVVTHTGMATQMGKIAHLLSSAKADQSPLQKRLGKLGKQLGILCLVVCFVVAFLGLLRGEQPLDMLICGISLAVAAVPEGLPTVVTLSLALATGRMLKQNALVRRLPLVESLGSVDIICCDKTGTLTQNKMALQLLCSANGRILNLPPTDFENHLLLSSCLVYCNRLFWESDAAVNPTEAALYAACKPLIGHFESARFIKESPFDSAKKQMRVLVEKDGKKTLFVKGAAESILKACNRRLVDGILCPFSAADKRANAEALRQLAADGLRMIVFAACESATSLEETGLIFLGYAGLADPPRAETKEAIEVCKDAGIRTVMITGDSPETALAIGRKIGLAEKEIVLTGQQLNRLSDAALQQAVSKTEIYARVLPEHKLRIVRALKALGKTVAMTGDGVNDAPAIKEADIGIAMGKNGTDVTRESAGIVLLDDCFSTIVRAIREGRAIYDNIRRSIRYLLSCNFGEILCMFLAMIFGLPTLLLPIQILLVNFVTDGLPALALGLEPPETGIMTRKPRDADSSVFSDGLWIKILIRGCLIGLATLFSFVAVFNKTGGNVAAARTAALMTLILTQLIHALECKSEQKSLLHIPLFNNPKLLGALGLSFLILLGVLYLPFLQPIFSTYPLSFGDFLLCFCISLAVPTFLILADFCRMIFKKKNR